MGLSDMNLMEVEIALILMFLDVAAMARPQKVEIMVDTVADCFRNNVEFRGEICGTELSSDSSRCCGIEVSPSPEVCD